jgi:hypothetical protein
MCVLKGEWNIMSTGSMTVADVEAYVMGLENVQREEQYGYIFFFVGDDHRLPFATLAQADYDYDNVSNLSREGVFRVNIGISKASYDALMGDVDAATVDQTALNVFLPHPEYARQHFICILTPSDDNIAATQRYIVEAHGIAAARLARRG